MGASKAFVNQYWKERQAKAQDTLNNRGIRATERQLKDYYQKLSYKTRKQFEELYNKLVMDAALKGITNPTPADLYRLDAYWQMQAQLTKELEKLGDFEARVFADDFMKHYQNAYKLALPSGGAFSTVSAETAQQMINAIWCADGKSWSDRIWANTAKLKQSLNDNLIECVITGKPTSVLKKQLMHEFGVSYSRADSIVRTEYAHIQTEAARQRYKDSGVKEVEVWADWDERRCDICGDLHEKRFPVNGQMPLPAHPRCRCRILPVIDRENEQLSFEI